jgi:hypothetical protein
MDRADNAFSGSLLCFWRERRSLVTINLFDRENAYPIVSIYIMADVNWKSVTLQSALMAAIVSVIAVGSNITYSAIHDDQSRKDSLQIAAADKRLEVAQRFYTITSDWMFSQSDLSKLTTVHEEFEAYYRSHALYLTTEGRSQAVGIILKMRGVEKFTTSSDQDPKAKAFIDRVCHEIPRFQEALLKSVWLEPEARDTQVYGM